MTISLLKDYKAKHNMETDKNLSVNVISKSEKGSKQNYLEDLNNRIDEATLFINEVIPLLDKSCSKYVDILKELLIKKEQNSQGQQGPSFNKKKTKNKSKRKATTKKMYSKIANECHPDKTEDKERHKLFLEAAEALENGDDYKMYEIYSNFDDVVTIDDCIDIDTEILSKTLALNKIYATNSYKISTIYRNGQIKQATTIYLQGIMEHIQKIEMEIWTTANN